MATKKIKKSIQPAGFLSMLLSMAKDRTSLLFVCLLGIACQLISCISKEDEEKDWKPKEGLELIGISAPSLEGLEWLNARPLQIEDMRGKVVLIRFWLVGCPFCEHTAPALVHLYNKYKNDGFIVIGIHHPKSDKAKDSDVVLKKAKAFAFNFPIAKDNDWRVINAYWLGGKERAYTSSSFLIDKKGIIRLVHDGGEFFESEDNRDADRAYHTIESKIQQLLRE